MFTMLADRLTLQEYRLQRRTFITSSLFAVAFALFLSALPGLIMWAAISAYDPRNSASGFVTFIFVAAGLVVIGIILVAAGSSVSQSAKQFQEAKNLFLKTAPEEDRARYFSNKKRAALGTCLCIGAAFVAVIGVNVSGSVQVRSTYEEGIDLIAAGDYQQAQEKLLQIEDADYKDTDNLLALCDAHIDYAAGNLSGAYFAINSVDISNQSTENMGDLTAFKNRVNAEYDAYCEEQERIRAEAYESKIRNGVPYVGMSESRIGDTSLGKPSGDVRHNYECINGEQYLANLYDFTENGHTVFTARCVRGTVTEVWDNRDQDTSRPTYRPSTSDNGSDDDPYNVNDYHHAEDFYYDHYDDFFDYYDAEDYFNEHHD